MSKSTVSGFGDIRIIHQKGQPSTLEDCPWELIITRKDYEESMKVYRDLNNVGSTAERKGRESGRAEGRDDGRDERSIETARRMKAKGKAVEEIAELADLPAEVILRLYVAFRPTRADGS